MPLETFQFRILDMASCALAILREIGSSLQWDYSSEQALLLDRLSLVQVARSLLVI